MMDWEKILVGILAVGLLIWFLPGVKHSLKNRPKATSADWRAFLWPIVIVVLFVMFLISTVRG